MIKNITVGILLTTIFGGAALAAQGDDIGGTTTIQTRNTGGDTTSIVFNKTSGDTTFYNGTVDNLPEGASSLFIRSTTTIGAEVNSYPYKSFSPNREGRSSSYVGSYYSDLLETNIFRVKIGETTEINRRNMVALYLAYQGTTLDNAYGILTDEELAGLDNVWPYYSIQGYLHGVGLEFEYGFKVVPAISINPFVGGYYSSGTVCAQDNYTDQFLATNVDKPSRFHECYSVKASNFDVGTRVVVRTPYNIEPYIGVAYTQANMRGKPYEAVGFSAGMQVRFKSAFTNVHTIN